MLAQIKTGNNSYTLNNEIIKKWNLLYQHNKITQNLFNKLIILIMEVKTIVLRDPKIFYFDFEIWNMKLNLSQKGINL